MDRKTSASIVEIELKQLSYKKNIKKRKPYFKMLYSYEANGNNVMFDCEFEFRLSTMMIKSKYFYEIILHDLDPTEVDEIIKSDEEEVFFPLLSKMSALIMKVTEEVNPFPFVTSTEIWNIERISD